MKKHAMQIHNLKKNVKGVDKDHKKIVVELKKKTTKKKK